MDISVIQEEKFKIILLYLKEKKTENWTIYSSCLLKIRQD